MRACGLWLATLGVVLGGSTARAQGTKEEAALVVEGNVREVFRSLRQDRVDYLVEVEVRRAELGRTPRNPVRVLVPAPGDAVYVHVDDRSGVRDRRPAGVPGERSQVKVYLAPRAGGGWELASADGVELTANDPVPAGASDPPPAVTENAPVPSPANVPGPASPGPAPGVAKAVIPSLGLTGEGLNVKGRYALRVISTERGGPAHRAGIEPGDMILGANDRELTGSGPLDELARKGGALTLVVLDVNTGKGVRVPVELAAATQSPPVTADRDTRPVPAPTSPIPAPVPSSAPAKRSLGFAAEPVSLGVRTGMKVVRVDPGSPAEKAGLEPGDVIVAVNDVPVTSVETMSSALHKSGPTPKMTVRDTRTGRDTPITINVAGDGPRPADNPAPTLPNDPQGPTGGGRRLGLVGEVVFLDTDSAVKVTEVEPGSAAATAGIKPGDVIIEANGTPILHPNTLNEVVGKSGATLRLVIVDPRSGRKGNVDVNLGAGR